METSAFSRRIRDLELRLGVQLFDRRSREVRLTPAGRKLLPLAKDIVDRLDALRAQVHEGQPEELVIGLAVATPRGCSAHPTSMR